MRAATREVAAGVIAGGVNPETCIIFNQSQVPEHAELAWLFNYVARLGWLNRMTQFKEKLEKIVTALCWSVYVPCASGC